MIIQISAGQGPAECRLAVAKLFEALKREYGDLEILSETKGHERGCLDSVRFRTEHDLSGLEGTVLWICRSPFRRNHKRKNWYVDVSVLPEVKEETADREYRIEKFHCGGKGGQNVNKVEHYRIVRGNPVRTYEGERFLLKERKDGNGGLDQ